jgi:DNA-binding beta-propeller fold protein YncE
MTARVSYPATKPGPWLIMQDRSRRQRSFGHDCGQRLVWRPQPPYASASRLGWTGHLAADQSVTPINTATSKAGKAITVGASGAIAIAPNGQTAYVVSSSCCISWTVTPINTATDKAGKPITVGGAPPRYIAITPNGQTVYVVNTGPYGDYGDTVTPINTATSKAGKPITVGKDPGPIAITPNGKTAYVTSTGEQSPLMKHGIGDTVTPINTATSKAGKAIKVGKYPNYIAIARLCRRGAATGR